MAEVTTSFPVIVLLCSVAGFGGLVLGVLLALLFGAGGTRPASLSAREAEARIADIHRAAQQSMMANAFRRSGRRRIHFPEESPIDGEWQEGGG